MYIIYCKLALPRLKAGRLCCNFPHQLFEKLAPLGAMPQAPLKPPSTIYPRRVTSPPLHTPPDAETRQPPMQAALGSASSSAVPPSLQHSHKKTALFFACIYYMCVYISYLCIYYVYKI